MSYLNRYERCPRSNWNHYKNEHHHIGNHYSIGMDQGSLSRTRCNNNLEKCNSALSNCQRKADNGTDIATVKGNKVV
jgi:hypothetical protein